MNGMLVIEPKCVLMNRNKKKNKVMTNWIEELLSYYDKSKDGKLDISELVTSLSPNVDNLYDCTKEGPCKKSTMTNEKAEEIGKRNAKTYIAMLLQGVPSALEDKLIDLNELKKHASNTCIIKLYKVDNEGNTIVDEEGYGVPTEEGAEKLKEAEKYI